jgi:hypothetical protein
VTVYLTPKLHRIRCPQNLVSPAFQRSLADTGFSGVLGFAIGAVNAGVVALIRKGPKKGHA